MTTAHAIISICLPSTTASHVTPPAPIQEERSKVDELRGTPMSVGSLEEIIDDSHAIVSTSVGSEHYVSILSFVDKDLLEPGCSVLLNHKVCYHVEGCILDAWMDT